MYSIDAHVHPSASDLADQGSRLLSEMDRHGIALLIMSNIGPYTAYPSAAEIALFNREARGLCEAHPRRLYYLVYLNPLESNWREVLREHQGSGQALGIKLWISLKDSSGSLAPTRAVLAAAAETCYPVLLHVYERTDPRLPGEIGLAEFAALAREFPDLPMLGAHAGGNWREGAAWRRQLPARAYLDICGGFPERGMLEALVSDGFSRRVLFGSDACGRSFASQLSKVTLASVPASVKRAVLVQNAADFFGLSTRQVGAAVGACRRSAVAAGPVSATGLGGGVERPVHDHFCFAGCWPLARHGVSGERGLVQALRRGGYSGGYAVCCEGLLSHDWPSAQVSWLRRAALFPLLRPLLGVNPFSRASLETLSCGERFSGVWLSPYFHQYALNDPVLLPLLAAWAASGWKVWINLGAGDHRFRPRSFGGRQVTAAEWGEFCRVAPSGCYVVQGGNMGLLLQAETRQRDDVYFTSEFVSDTQRPPVWEERSRQLLWGSEYPLRDPRQVRGDVDAMYGSECIAGVLPG